MFLQRQQSATDPVSRKGVGYYGSAAIAEPKTDGFSMKHLVHFSECIVGYSAGSG